MDPRRVALFLSLLVCALGASPPSSFKNGRPDSIRRRIGLNEYLVPPPPPPKFPPGRTARLAPPAEQPGYFAKLMSWLNPFNYVSESPPSRHEAHSPQPRYVQPPPLPPPPPLPLISAASGYGGSSPPAAYDRPPLPPIFNNHPEYHAPAKSCNPCNKVPWVPVSGEPSHHHHQSADLSSSFAPPSLQSSPPSAGYLPPNNVGAHDAYHAASQEVLPFALPTAGQNAPLLGPLPSAQLYPGATPPLYQATDFNHPVQPTLDGLPEYLDAPPPSGNDVFPGIAESGRVEQRPIYPTNNPSAHADLGVVHQNLGYSGLGVSGSGLEHVQNHGGQGDLSSSGSQVSHGHLDPVLGAPGLENIGTHHHHPGSSFDAVSYQTPFGGSVVADHQTSGVLDNGGFHIAGPSGLADLLDNSSQVVPSLPSSYGISGPRPPDQNYEHRYNDLSSSGSVVTDSHAPPRTTDGSPAKIEDPIHFEESPLLDLTHKGESRTSPIPPTSNALVDLNESAETSGATTLAPGLLGTRSGVAVDSTELRYPPHGVLKTIESPGSLEKSNAIDDAANGIHRSTADPREQKVSYFQSLTHSLAGYFRPDVSPTTAATTTLRSTERGSLWGSLVNVYDGVIEPAEQSGENVDVDPEDTTRDAGHHSSRRNKKVQVIIPYTSKHTPVPFQPLRDQNYGRKVSYGATADSARGNYVGEESRGKIKVTDLPPDFSRNLQTWPATVSAISPEEVTGKPAGSQANNSIDVHRLQKNIDNWTIQEYSRGTTASTVSPSSAKSYLFPSKQIPDKYLTTTEPIGHADGFREESVKTFTLGGFSFNDQEHESSSSNRVEAPRVQVVIGGKDQPKASTESFVDIVTSRSTNDFAWRGYPMDISPVSKERVYVVTPQPTVTSPRTTTTTTTTTTTKAERKDLTKAPKTDIKVAEENTDPFESIEKAYQVLPQAVNNLAVASTGPDKVPLWGIMEHEEFGSLGDSGHDDDDDEDSEAEVPVLYGGHSKVSRARR